MPKNLFKLFRDIILVTLFFSCYHVNAQNISNEGNDFWVCFPSHIPSGTEQNGGVKYASLSVFITSKNNSSGKIFYDGLSQTFSVKANTVQEIELPRENTYIGDGTNVFSNKGIRILVDDNQPDVVVYAHIFAGSRSAASLVLPVKALGQKYYAMSFTNFLSNAHTQFNVVAISPNTKIKITPVINKVKEPPFYEVLEKAGDVYQYQSRSKDITGSIIEVDESNSCNKIAVFSGSDASLVIEQLVTLGNSASVDPLFQQLYPLESLGKNYALVPFYGRDKGSIYRFLATENNTEIIYKTQTIKLNAGEYYTTPADNSVSYLSSNKNIIVGQYALTQLLSDSRNFENNIVALGDPDMVILNPLEYSIKNITLYSSTKLAIKEQYLNITIPTRGVNSFKLNGQNIATQFNILPNNANYSFAQINLTNKGSNFNLVADIGFTAIAYGFGNAESYAYSAGTSLAGSKSLLAIDSEKGVVKTSELCIDNTYDFKVILPYISTKLIWELNGVKEKEEFNPQYTEIVENEATLYEYTFLANKKFENTGPNSLVIYAVPPPSDNVCYINQEEVLKQVFVVYDMPQASFNSSSSLCLNQDVLFEGNTNLLDIEVGEWYWDFGDGNYSNLKNPVHKYTSLGSYTLKFYVKNIAGCISKIVEKQITVKPIPTASFTNSASICTSLSSVFVNNTLKIDNYNNYYEWFVNGEKVSEKEHLEYSFANEGNYSILLNVKNDISCISTFSKTVYVNKLPSINFELDKYCINDEVRLNAIYDDTLIEKVYWTTTFDNDKIEDKLFSKTFSKTGIYQISLFALTKTGCQFNITKDILISGAEIKSDFEIVSSINLCNDDILKLKNQSKVDYGNIIKLEWLLKFDSGNEIIVNKNPLIESGDLEISLPEILKTTKCQISLKAFSGNGCYHISNVKEIIIYAKPQFEYQNTKLICLNTADFELKLNNVHQSQGIGVFTGKGIKEKSEIFSPALAGVGVHEIHYNFNSDEGCETNYSFFIDVKSIPEIFTYNKEVDILYAGEYQMNISLVKYDDSFRYEWFPKEGVSDDKILNPILSPKQNTQYLLKIYSGENCVIDNIVTVNVHANVNIPNAFSPNGDGINDTWNIKYLESFTKADIKIFNRYGQIVFSSVGYPKAWDGTFNGKDLPVGVYYYVIEPKNERERFKGSITLIK